MSRSCLPSAGSRSTTPPSTGGWCASRRCWPTPPGPVDTAVGSRWQVDETDVKVAGQWRYVYRAIDQFGQVIDVFVSPRRDATAARRFFQQAISSTKVTPTEVATDKATTYPIVLDDLLPAVWHHTEQYANNPLECDHGRLKARLRRCAAPSKTGAPESSSPGMPSCRTSPRSLRTGGRSADQPAGSCRIR
jgi:transposase-like protein